MQAAAASAAPAKPAAPTASAPAAPQFLEDEAEPQFNLSFAPVPGNAAGSLAVVFDRRDDKNFYALDVTAKSVALRAVVEGVSRPLDSAAVRVKADSAIVLKRRPWLMQVVVDRRVVLTAYDATFDSGKIGSVPGGGWSWKEPRVQPVEEIYFADDFTRADTSQNADWKTAGGEWKLTSASPTVTVANREMSANPFSYQAAMPKGRAFAQAGRWFWDNYESGVSVRPMSAGAVGLAVYVQDDKNYLAFTWNATEGPQARQLVRVVDGKSTILARSAGAYLPRQWYRLSVRTSPGYVETFIDGAPVFKASNNFFGQGGIALLATNVTSVNFDDARVKSHPFYRLDFLESDGAVSGGGWTPRKGVWKAHNRVLISSPAAADPAARFMLTGRSDWNRYEMTTAAAAGQNGACGLIVGYSDDKNYALFRWAGASSKLPFRGRQQLLRVRNGQAKVIHDAPLGLKAAPDGFARVTVRLAAGAFTVYSGNSDSGDGDIIAQMTDESLASGRAGLWSQGVGSVAFRNASVEFLSEPPSLQVAPRMAADALMVQYGWASPAGEWKLSNGDSGPELWNTGDFFGDSSLQYQWPRSATGKLELALRARRGAFDSGWMVRCEGAGEGKPLRLTLLYGGKVLKQRDFTPKAKNTPKSDTPERIPLRVDWEGRALMLSVGGQPALSYLSSSKSADPNATSFAARVKGFGLEAKDLRAISPQRDDYTFTEAPTDWYAPQGNWGVIARWPCSSDWSFFGTKGTAPVLWSKRVFNDDVVVETYIHNQMDLPGPPGYSKPGNLNITLAGDGKNPMSGYGFIFAGWHNTKSAILKGRQVVAENTTEKGRYATPTSGGDMRFHRGWTYIRASVRRASKDGRNGAQVTLTVDDEKIAEYFDPTPVQGFGDSGRVAFWTVNSTLSIARVKIESASNNGRTLPSGLLDATPPAPMKPLSGTTDLMPRPRLDDGLASALVELEADIKSSAPVWMVRDPASGGTFAVQLAKPTEAADKTSSWQVTPNTRLDMELALGAETKIDLYATINGVRHLVMLSGIAKSESGKSDGDVKLLGDARPSTQPVAAVGSGEGSAASGANWQHVSFDLGKALQKLYPGASNWNISEITLGALHGDDYRWAGLHGNPMGATYRLRRARLSESAAKEPIAKP